MKNKKDELDSITTLRQVSEVITRVNKKLETVYWDFHSFKQYIGLKREKLYYRLVKNTKFRDKNNDSYWWPKVIIGNTDRRNFLKEFRQFCRTHKRDTLSKAAYTHKDALRCKEAMEAKQPEQKTLF